MFEISVTDSWDPGNVVRQIRPESHVNVYAKAAYVNVMHQRPRN